VPYHTNKVRQGVVGIRREDLLHDEAVGSLSDAAFRVWVTLRSVAHWGQHTHRGLAVVDPATRRLLADRCGKSDRTVRRLLRELEDAGLVQATAEPTDDQYAVAYRDRRFCGGWRDEQTLPPWVGGVLALLSAAPGHERPHGPDEPGPDQDQPATRDRTPGHQCPGHPVTSDRMAPVSDAAATGQGRNVVRSELGNKKNPTYPGGRTNSARARSADGRAFEKPDRDQDRPTCHRTHPPDLDCNAMAKTLRAGRDTRHLDPRLADRLVHVALVRHFGGREAVPGMVSEYARGGVFDPSKAKGRTRPDETDVIFWVWYRLTGIARKRGYDGRTIRERIKRPLLELIRQYRDDQVPVVEQVEPTPTTDTTDAPMPDAMREVMAMLATSRRPATTTTSRPAATVPQDNTGRRVFELRDDLDRMTRMCREYPQRADLAARRDDVRARLWALEQGTEGAAAALSAVA